MLAGTGDQHALGIVLAIRHFRQMQEAAREVRVDIECIEPDLRPVFLVPMAGRLRRLEQRAPIAEILLARQIAGILRHQRDESTDQRLQCVIARLQQGERFFARDGPVPRAETRCIQRKPQA
ncbi:hypothetical protein [Pandoraea pnomenusa]|uniref:hypothetical protein n=1 Tax=Pandoraea pnomenusa TaxID=93220 RepID=UPI0012DAE844|nr:hypothetical protein [Pandoraea pnomenusa]